MNCVDSVANGAISRDLAGEFIREWAKRCADVTNPAEIFGKLRILRETDPRFRAATGRAIPAFRNSVFTVIEYARLFNQLHADTLLLKISELHSLAMDFSNCCDEGSRQDLEKYIIKQRITERPISQGIASVLFTWVLTTKTVVETSLSWWHSKSMPGNFLKRPQFLLFRGDQQSLTPSNILAFARLSGICAAKPVPGDGRYTWNSCQTAPAFWALRRLSYPTFGHRLPV